MNFWLTVQPNGEMWYDEDSSLQTEGVGHLSYAVAVQWTAAPRVRVPSAPQELETDDVEAEEVELDWDRPDDDGGAAVDAYRVEIYRGGRWREEDDDISPTRYTVEDLDPYTHYTFRVAAHNAAGWGPASAEVSVATPREEPGQPRSLMATATHDRVTLTWQAPTSGGQVTGYRVERSAAGGGSPWRVVAADTGSAVTYWVDRAVTPATTYEYDVQALNHGEPGRWSSEETVITLAAPTIPGSPTGLGVAPSAESQLQLTWLAPAALGGGVTGYRIERSPDVNPRTWDGGDGGHPPYHPDLGRAGAGGGYDLPLPGECAQQCGGESALGRGAGTDAAAVAAGSAGGVSAHGAGRAARGRGSDCHLRVLPAGTHL